ncbi:membrane protein containing ATPase, P-type cation-transporter, partial [gut metagenome]
MAVFVATMIGFTILEPVHLLWINLITDCFPALALGMEPAEPGIMRRAPRSSKDGIFAGGMGIDVLFQGAVIACFTLLSYFIGEYFLDGRHRHRRRAPELGPRQRGRDDGLPHALDGRDVPLLQ